MALTVWQESRSLLWGSDHGSQVGEALGKGKPARLFGDLPAEERVGSRAVGFAQSCPGTCNYKSRTIFFHETFYSQQAGGVVNGHLDPACFPSPCNSFFSHTHREDQGVLKSSRVEPPPSKVSARSSAWSQP